MNLERCEMCKWWANDATCRRHAPAPRNERDVLESFAAILPETAYDDFCGEFVQGDAHE